MILLSDANVLIDLGYVGGLAVLTQLGQVEVLDVVFDECCHPSQADLPGAIEAAGIQRVTVLTRISHHDSYQEATSLAIPTFRRLLQEKQSVILPDWLKAL